MTSRCYGRRRILPFIRVYRRPVITTILDTDILKYVPTRKLVFKQQLQTP